MSNRYASYDEYGLCHLPRHLLRGGRWRKLEILTDFDFIEAKVSRLKTPIPLIQDYDWVIAQSKSIHPSGFVEDAPLIQRLREMRKHVWAEASALSQDPSCVIQQLANRLQWSSTDDDYLKKQANQALQRNLDAGRPIFRTLLPNPDSYHGTQRVLEVNTANTVGMAMIDRGLVLWSAAGDWRILDKRGSISQRGYVLPIPLQQLTGHGTALAAVSGRVLRYWEEWPQDERVITKTLPFVVLQVALTCQGKEMMAIGNNGEWSRYSVRAGDLKECESGRVNGKGTCCAVSPAAEYWVIGTRVGQVILCDHTHTQVIAEHHGMVRAVAINPRGDCIASGGQDGILQLIALDGSATRSIECRSWINDITFSTDGKQVFWVTELGQLLSLVVDQSDEIPLAWISDDKPLERVCIFPVTSAAAESENGSAVATAAVLASDYRARLVEQPQPTASLWRSPLSGDVKYIVEWGDAQSVLAIDSEDNCYIIGLGSSPPQAQCFSEPAGSVLAAAAPKDKQLVTIYQDLGRTRVTRRYSGLRVRRERILWPQGLWWRVQSLFSGSSVMSGYSHAAFSPDLQTFALVKWCGPDMDGRIEVYDATTAKKAFAMGRIPSQCSAMAISNKAKRILVAGELHLPPKLFSTEALSDEATNLPLEGCRGAAFSGAGNELLVIDMSGKPWFFQNPPQGECLDKISDGVVCGDLSPDARWIVLCNSDGQVVLIDRSAAAENLKIRRAFLPWKASYCQVYPPRQWILLGGDGNLQILEWNP